ncbi:S8 family peptidase [Caminicella sporogenes]|uniref:S8 family peptidase n=1 Tax=Caminicella sporogenes TaxID=166485 RepID=UPI002541B5AB|nr:S8 family serine peptidase [Caminicella sporogenes]WIF94035.1 S8 family serine peptidase [Caminicella sporogenes]
MKKRSIKNFLCLLLILSISFSGITPWSLENVAQAMYDSDEEVNKIPENSIPGEIIVRFKENRVNTFSIFSKKGLCKKESEDKYVLYKVKAGEKIDKIINEIESDPSVEYAEPNMIYYLADFSNGQTVNTAVYDEVYEDKYITEQWALEDIDAREAWEKIGNPSRSVTIAVIDTGVDYNHPDLKGRVLKGKNFAKKNGAGGEYPSGRDALDDEGHGTMVAGIISAKKDNKIGIAGVAGLCNIKILPLKAMNSAGYGSTFDIAEAIRYAADKKVDIINMSLGGKGYSKVMADAVAYAQEKGVLVIAASGNEGADVGNFYPAALPGVLTVGAIDKYGGIAKFSNYGEAVDIVAPGVNIISTTIEMKGSIGNEEEGYYAVNNGTSFSAPYVAGVAAVYKLLNPGAKSGQIKHAITASAVDIKEDGWDEKSGYGKLNMKKAIDSDLETKHFVEILNPKRGSYITDKVTFKMQILNDEINKMIFYIDKINEEQKIGEVSIKGADIYKYEWDSNKVKNGIHTLFVAVYSNNQLKDKCEIPIHIVNNPKSGIVLKIKDPDGNRASWANVMAYKKEIDDKTGKKHYDLIWSGRANAEGIVRIPATLVHDLDEVSVIIEGKFDFKDAPEGNTLFIYHKDIEGPGTFEINGEHMTAVKFNTIDKSGKALTDVQYYATVVDEDNIVVGTTASLNNDKDKSPTIYMEQGKYNLFAYSKTDKETYFLTQWAKEIEDDKQSMEIVFDGRKTGQVSLKQNKEESKVERGILYLYNDATESSIGFNLEGEKIFVTADKYKYIVDIEVADAENGENWIYTFQSLEDVEVFEDKWIEIEVGGKVVLTEFVLDDKSIKNYVERTKPGLYNSDDIIFSKKDEIKIYEIPKKYTMAYTKHQFTDKYGNILVKLRRGSLVNDEISYYNDVREQNIDKEIAPAYKITRMNDGYEIYNRKFTSFYTYAFWFIGNPKVTLGDYKVSLTLEKNPLAEKEISTYMINRIYDKQLNSMKLKNQNGKVLIPYTWIYSVREDENGNYSWEQVYGLWCDRNKDKGNILIGSSAKLSDKKNGNLAIFRYIKEDGKSVFIFRSFTTLDELEKNLIVDETRLQDVKINAVDKDGNKIESIRKTRNIIYTVKVGNEQREVMLDHDIGRFYKDGVYLEEGNYGFSGQFTTLPDKDKKYSNYYLVKSDVDIKEGKVNEVVLDGKDTVKIIIDPKIEGYNDWRGTSVLPYSKYTQGLSTYYSQGNIFYISAGIKYDDIDVILALGDPEDPSYVWSYIFEKEKDITFKKDEVYTWKLAGNFKAFIKLDKENYLQNERLSGKVNITDEYGNKLEYVHICTCYKWISNNKFADDNKICVYYKNVNGEIVPKIYDKDNYSIAHEKGEKENDFKPHLRIYRVENNREERIFDQSKMNYYKEFNESLKEMDPGRYRVEIAFAAGPNGPIVTQKSEGFFNLKKSEQLILDWYQDGDYSADADGENESVEQFFIIFNKGVKDVKFKIIIPDNTKEDPYGKGAFKIIDKNTNNIELPKDGEISLFISEDVCRDDDYQNGYSSKYLIELTADWTEIFDTKRTGYNYYDERFNPIRLVAEGFSSEEENNQVVKVDGVSGATNKPNEGNTSDEENKNQIIASRDIVLVKDIQRPKIVYEMQVAKAKGENQNKPGTVGVTFNEPVQINAPYFEDHHGFNPITPAQGQEAPLFKAKYIMVEDIAGNPVSNIEVEGKYKGNSCLWKSTLIRERQVDGEFKYDVYPFDNKNRIKCTRDFGWSYIEPERELEAGKWKLVISGITDDAGNLMKKHEIDNIEISNILHLKINEITKTGVTVTYTKPIQKSGWVRLIVQEPNCDSHDHHSKGFYVLWKKVKAGEQKVTFKFKEPFERLEEGIWKVNGLSYNVSRASSGGSSYRSSGGSGGSTTVKSEDKGNKQIKQVSSNGGKLEFLNGVIIEVDEGTFDEKVEITVEIIEENKVKVPINTLTTKLEFASKVYEFNSKGKKFNKAITVSLPYDKNKVEDINKLGVYLYDEKAKKWEYIGGKVDEKRGVITVQLKHFSKYAVMIYNKTFEDIKNHWARDDIEYMASKHIVSGRTEIQFLPDENISRAEFITLLVKAIGLDTNKTENPFRDVSKDAWYAAFVGAAYKEGLVKGMSFEEFSPNENITREQMTVMIMKAYTKIANRDYNDLIVTTMIRFSDEDKISSWAHHAIIVANSFGIVKGRSNGIFAPKNHATRAEAVVMIKRLLEVLENL